MTITAVQKTAIEEVINIIINTSPPRGKRHLSTLFLELVDRTEWPEYYEVSVPVVTGFWSNSQS